MPPRSSAPAKAPTPQAKARLVSEPAKRGTAEHARRRQLIEQAVDRFVADNDDLLEDLAK